MRYIRAMIDVDLVRSTSHVPVRVRFAETDAMGVVHHGSYPLYLELARVEWLRRRGVSYREWSGSDLHLPVVELNLRYRSPSFFDDELLIAVSIAEVRTASLRFEYQVLRDATVIAEASTLLACVSSDRKLMRLSPEILGVLGRGEVPTNPA